MKMPENKKNNEAPQREYTKVETMNVRSARVVNNAVVADIEVNGIGIRGCWVRQTKNGKDFISMPQYKGKDGKFYNVVYCYLSPEHEETLLAMIEKAINE